MKTMIKDLVVAALVLGSFTVGAVGLAHEARAPWPEQEVESQMLTDGDATMAPAFASTYVISASATRCQ